MEVLDWIEPVGVRTSVFLFDFQMSGEIWHAGHYMNLRVNICLGLHYNSHCQCNDTTALACVFGYQCELGPTSQYWWPDDTQPKSMYNTTESGVRKHVLQASLTIKYDKSACAVQKPGNKLQCYVYIEKHYVVTKLTRKFLLLVNVNSAWLILVFSLCTNTLKTQSKGSPRWQHAWQALSWQSNLEVRRACISNCKFSRIDGNWLGRIVCLVDAHQSVCQLKHVISQANDDELSIFSPVLDVMGHSWNVLEICKHVVSAKIHTPDSIEPYCQFAPGDFLLSTIQYKTSTYSLVNILHGSSRIKRIVWKFLQYRKGQTAC